MAAYGKVCTGFSAPYVAKYDANGGSPTYTEVRRLARGVEVSLEPETSDDNIFYADNQAAESAPGTFTSGSVTLTVDGLHKDAERFIMGVSTETINGVEVLVYGDDSNPPYVGIGFVARYMSDGVTTYDAIVLTKGRFSFPSTSASTQEEEIDWQTQKLNANIMRDDSPSHNWKLVAEDFATEDAAITALVKVLGGN